MFNSKNKFLSLNKSSKYFFFFFFNKKTKYYSKELLTYTYFIYLYKIILNENT